MRNSKKVYFILWMVIGAVITGCIDSDTIVQSLMDISGAPLEYDDSGAGKHLNIASVCLQCSKEKPENLANMRRMIDKVMTEKPHTELIIFGESILGWYYNPDDPKNYQRMMAETIPGQSTDSIRVWADFYDVYIVFSLGELQGDKLYNAQVLIDPDGEIQAVHRKYHLVKEDEKSGFSPYPKPTANVTVVDIKGIRAGMIICADIGSYWLTRQMIDNGVELILHSLASCEGEFKIDAVARQFNAWVVFANRCGQEGDFFYEGNCYIADPAGTIRVGGNGRERYEYYQIGVY